MGVPPPPAVYGRSKGVSTAHYHLPTMSMVQAMILHSQRGVHSQGGGGLFLLSRWVGGALACIGGGGIDSKYHHFFQKKKKLLCQHFRAHACG